MKNYLKVVYGLIAVSAVNLIAMLCLMPGLPERIPVHFNYRFAVDSMGPRAFILLAPAIVLLFTIAMAVEQKIRGRDYANNKPMTIFAVCFTALFIALGWMLYAMCGTGAQMGDVVEMPLDLLLGLGLSVLFIVLGNYLPTIQQNRTFGIKMPATFRSEACWRKTHRFGGRVFVIGGFFSAICALTGHFSGARWLVLAGLLLGIFGSMAIILVYVRKIKDEE